MAGLERQTSKTLKNFTDKKFISLQIDRIWELYQHGFPVKNFPAKTIEIIRGIHQVEEDVNLIALYSRIPKHASFKKSPLKQAISIRKWILKNKKRMSQFTHLDLEGLNLTLIPQEIHYFRGLIQLFLNKNRLTSVPNFSSFPDLEYLDLDDNQLHVIPDFTELVNLKVLLLEGNQITTLPSLRRLQSLEALNVINNPLNEIPNLHHYLPNLEHIYVYPHEMIPEVSDSFSEAAFFRFFIRISLLTLFFAAIRCYTHRT